MLLIPNITPLSNTILNNNNYNNNDNNNFPLSPTRPMIGE